MRTTLTHVTTKQTYLDAPTIQSMLVSLRQDVRNTEGCINYYKVTAQCYWGEALGKGTNTDYDFQCLNALKDDIRQERKHLANLVKQIKGLKAMLKDAV